MNRDIFKKFGEMSPEILMELISSCMDDYLYVIDLQKNAMEISQSAVDRFMLSDRYLDDAANDIMAVIYKEDRGLFKKHLEDIIEGREKVHNIHYRWIDKNGQPVWVNCRGLVTYDKDGKAEYLVGCLNETGNQRRADNTTGLLGGVEFNAYMRSHKDEITKGFLMHIGINNFGAINSSRGSEFGNYILRGVAETMKKCLLPSQKLYHLVADQYVIVDLESESMEDAVELSNRINEKLYEFIVSEDYEAVFSVSIGVIKADVFTKEGYDECRRKFSFALKQAKSIEKNGFYIFDEADYEEFLKRAKIIAALRSSVVNQYEGMEVYYQPIVDCESEKIIGAEALMRFSMMNDDKPEMISPVEFIPLLEESGLIIPAGRFVLSEAVKMCCEMQKYIPDFKINVNISYVQIMQGNVAADILGIIKEYSLKPQCLCIEMTESGFVDMTPSFCKLRKVLDENNIQFVIDDFGTGYSNLHCIRDMKPSYVKMDKDFTSKAMNEKDNYELFYNITNMIHGIGVKICAEGIEESSWCSEMKNMHVDYLQGYYFGRPCTRDTFVALILRSQY